MDRFKMLNTFYTQVLMGIFIVVGILIYSSCKPQIPEPIIETKVDTVYVNVPDSSSLKQIDSLYSVIYSLERLNLTYEEELNIALFKLERIKDYNEIAARGNNIKYLRGWINRTLNE